MTAGATDLRAFLNVLRDHGQLLEVNAPVDPYLELAEIHRRVIAADGPALLFRNVKGSSFPVVTNLFGTMQRVHLAFQNRPEDTIRELVHLATHQFPPSLKTLWDKRQHIKALARLGTRKVRQGRAPVMDACMDPPKLESIPLIHSWPEDGGSFVTLPLVYTENPEGGPPNLGMYRIHRYDNATTGLHWQIGKGGGYHHHLAEAKGLTLPVTIFLGGPPALLMSAITPLPENVPELMLASLLQGSKLETSKHDSHPHPIIAHCEFAIQGHTKPHERRMEGPFGDHYGYYSLAHEFPVFHCQKVWHRKDAIYPATVVGKPRQEDFYIGDYLQELLSPLFPVVMPQVKALWSYGETGFHALSAAVIKERFYRESMVAAFRILGEGQLSLTKFLLLTDVDVDLKDFRKLLQVVLERFQPQTGLFIFSNLSLDTLDYTGPKLNHGSRGVMLGIGPKVRDLPTEWSGILPQPLRKAVPFCPGCLVVESTDPKLNLAHLASNDALKLWPLVVLVDDAAKATKSSSNFLWTTFTRFEPAADIYAGKTSIERHHLCYEGPIVIDARMKPSYPKELFCDATTAELVSKRWLEYFPAGLPMGSSDAAHLDF